MTRTGADIHMKDVGVTYPNGFTALRKVTLDIPAGQMVGIVGLSGAGKSTLVRAINGLVPITGGAVTVGRHELRPAGQQQMSSKELRELRSSVGMVFQSFNLVKRTSVVNNVLMGRLHHTSAWRILLGAWTKADVELAMSSLERVEIVAKAYEKASSLSGGQQQRVAIARTLAQQPQVILADEPVASLDPPTSHVVMRDLQRICADFGITVLVNLHFLDLAQRYCERLVGLRAGEIVFDGPGAQADEAVFENIYGRSLTAEDVLEAKAEI